MELRDYVNLLRSHAWNIIRIAVAVTAVAVLLTALQKPKYVGTAKILVTEQGKVSDKSVLGPQLPGIAEWPERGLETQAKLMELEGVASQVVEELSLPGTAGDLLSRVSATAVGTTNIIDLEVKDTDPQRAADSANALARAYVQWTREVKQSRASEAAKEVEGRLKEEAARIDAAEAALASGDRTGAREDELTAARSSYAQLSEELRTLRTEESITAGSGIVVATADVSRTPVSPNWPRNVGLGLTLGLALGLGSTFVMGMLDDTIRSSGEAAAIFGAPELGRIAADALGGEGGRFSLVGGTGGPADEPYGALRDRLAVINYDNSVKSLLVVSATDGVGTAVAANIAAVLARSGKKVALLDCDFRHSTLDSFFDVTFDKGISDVLVGGDPVMALKSPGIDGLWALHAGAIPPNPSELLGSAGMRDLVKSLGSWVDWIVLDAPPLTGAADAMAIARWADGVLVVTREGATTRQAAREARAALDAVEAHTIGVLVWGSPVSAAPRGRVGALLDRATSPRPKRPDRGRS